MFGVSSDKFLSYLFLSLKYYIYLCKFKKAKPSFDAFKLYKNTKRHWISFGQEKRKTLYSF